MLNENGVIKSELLFGKVNAVTANSVNFEYINLQHQATYYHGKRYGKGEVGEFILIESQVNLILGRIVEIKKDDLDKALLHKHSKAEFSPIHSNLRHNLGARST